LRAKAATRPMTSPAMNAKITTAQSIGLSIRARCTRYVRVNATIQSRRDNVKHL
jgi:hypothetical protein